ncbi:MAG TPA: metallophosphoesterase, partial [Flavisolibacter sp.]|nr:metallophosphoesterase [Flavisolibacter sp.]
MKAIASLQYHNPSFLRKLLIGENYREEWETPVQLPVLNLTAKELHIKELGGGKQTKSLKLLDKNGIEWALRSVDKDVRPAVPKAIRNGLTVSVVQDMVSAANPYAPMSIPPLAEAVGIKASVPRYYFVPDDTALGPYRDIFANTICILEQRDIMPGLKLEGTEKVLKDIMDDQKIRVNQEAFLNARLLDMLIGDWDRHYDQWKWAPVELNGKISYLPLPKDRDQAYFYSQGWLLKLIRLFGMDFSVGFTESTSNLVKLNSVARTLDELLLNRLSRNDWKAIAGQFQGQLSDSLIRSAVKELPPSIYALHGPAITEKLLQRKRTL